jgi:hypothetical protein
MFLKNQGSNTGPTGVLRKKCVWLPGKVELSPSHFRGSLPLLHPGTLPQLYCRRTGRGLFIDKHGLLTMCVVLFYNINKKFFASNSVLVLEA